MFENFKWMNPPHHWDLTSDMLVVTSDNKTDFWRNTFYGFVRNDGHFFYKEVSGDFTCEVDLLANFETLYDQLGLMIRASDTQWIKTGLEYTDGAVHISTVVTRDFSDWSMIKPNIFNGRLRIRLTRHGESIRIQYVNEEGVWTMLRLAHLDLDESCQIGIMCCSPERQGFKATFKEFQIKPAIPKRLHD